MKQELPMKQKLTGAEIERNYRASKNAEGFKRVTVWMDEPDIPAFKKYAKRKYKAAMRAKAAAKEEATNAA